MEILDEKKEIYDLSDHCLLQDSFNVNLNFFCKKKKRVKVEYYSVNERFKSRFVERMEQNIAEEGDVSSMALFEDLMK